MSANPETTNTTKNNLPLIRVLLAESDPSEIARIRSHIAEQFQAGIKIGKNYHELLENIDRERPQLVILGRIDKFNYFEICQECHKIQADLPIVLLSKQKIINDSFRELVKSCCGVTDVISEDSEKLNQLFQGLEKSTRQQAIDKPLGKPTDKPAALYPTNKSEQPQISGRIMLAALVEISIISNNYFGPLAQGNYWRKAHDRIVDEFPFIQNWSADHFSKLNCDDSILDQELTDDDIQSLRIWTRLFIEECERIIVDFRTILRNSDISPPAKDLLTKL
jgi:hypothetical protein